jgi:hypothetical protein
MFCRNANGRPATAYFPLNLATAFAELLAKMVTLHDDEIAEMADLPINHSSMSPYARSSYPDPSVYPSADRFAAFVLRASAREEGCRYFSSLFLVTY